MCSYQDLVEMLLAISNKPEVYFGGNPTLSEIRAFVLGYIYSKDQIGGTDYIKFDYDFSSYIRKAGSDDGEHWFNIIDKLYQNEDQKINEFKFLLIQFNNDLAKKSNPNIKF